MFAGEASASGDVQAGRGPTGSNTATCDQVSVPTIEHQVPMVDGSPIPTSVSGEATVSIYNGGGIVQRTPPAGWSPLRATPAELQYYGFPTKPTEDAAALSAWTAEWSNYRPATPGGPICFDRSLSHDATNTSWGGVVDTEDAQYTEAYTHVHQSSSNAGSCNLNNNIFSTWVGIGGYSVGDLLQNGQDAGTDVPASSKGPTGGVGAWAEVVANSVDYGTEWQPGLISPGDDVSEWTNYQSSPYGPYVVFGWHDLTTGISPAPIDQYTVDGTATGPSISEAYDGATAEFINERLSGSDVRYFYDQNWSDASATRDGITEPAGTWGHTILRLVNGSGQELAGLSPDELTSDSSWTMGWDRCN